VAVVVEPEAVEAAEVEVEAAEAEAEAAEAEAEALEASGSKMTVILTSALAGRRRVAAPLAPLCVLAKASIHAN
jgi:hypothetical protein